MNAITHPLRIVHDEASARVAAAVHVDMHLGIAIEQIADEMAALYEPRRTLNDEQASRVARLRTILVTLSHARDLNAAHLPERL